MRIPALLVFPVLIGVLLAGCSQAGHDSDGDGLTDGTESNWPPILVDLIDRRIRMEPTSDAQKVDTDGDGLSDFDEFFKHTDPRSNDTDRDGLTDCQEGVHSVASECEDSLYAGDYDGGTGTSPIRADSDPGPVRYLIEYNRFTDETGTLPNGPEWGDGLSDGAELGGYTVDLGQGRTRQVTSNPRNADSDADGLEDGEEVFLFSSDPTVTDSDGDTCTDGRDPWPNREEALSLGLDSMFLKVDKDLPGGSDLVLSGQVAGAGFSTPPSGSHRISRGQEEDLASLTPAAAPAGGCPLSPRFAWAKVQVNAFDPDGAGGGQQIDISSMTGAPFQPPQLPALWWNVRTGEYSWAPETTQRLQTPVVLEGADARLTFLPVVVFSQAS